MNTRRAVGLLALIWMSCGADSTLGDAGVDAGTDAGTPATLASSIDTVVVIYAENRSFDNLYGLFPGANGIAAALDAGTYLQKDRDGSILPHLPPAHGAPALWSFVAGLPNKPFQIDAQPGGSPDAGPGVTSPDLVHRFYNNQMQINGGTNDSFAAWSDSGGLSMGYYEGSSMKLWALAKEFTLADNFFMGAFGGSFLNHFWLVCACSPPWANPPASRVSVVDSTGHRLIPAATSPASALDGKPVYTGDLNVSPSLSGAYYGINTSQPPYQPSGTAPADGGSPLLAAADGLGSAGAVPVPPIASSVKTVGDTLTAKGITWAWYAGAWNASLADRSKIYNNAIPNFQAHHQPFNYFQRFDPTTAAGAQERTTHLKDYTELVTAAAAGALPQVTFYKPQGNLNQHPGYTDVLDGDEHLAQVVASLRASPQWKKMAIIITYDENGGFWDHVAPPAGDQWGPGSRVPALIISPWAKKGFVDHTSYDTTSIIKFLTTRFGLEALPGARANAGDLTQAFDFTQTP